MKKYLSIILVFMITGTLFMSCMPKTFSGEEVESTDFDSKKAQEVSDNYLNLLCENKVSEANKLLTEDLKKSSEGVSLGDTSIISYRSSKVIESSDKSSIVYDVIRSKSDSIRCDRDTFTIKVIQDGDNYKITEVKATNKNQVYSEQDKLRFVGEEGGDSQLIVDINNLHIDVYPKVKGTMIEKAKVPHDKFGVASISYGGKKVALTTTNGEDNFICVVDIDEGLVAQAEEGGASGEGNAAKNPKSEATEKSIAKKIIPLDVLKVEKIEKLVFSSSEQSIAVEYKENGKSRVKIYSAESGDLIDVGLDEKFSPDNYSIYLMGIDKKMIKIKVTETNNEKVYLIDLEKKEVKEEEK